MDIKCEDKGYNSMLILVLESSTSSAKALLYDTERQSCRVKGQSYPLHRWKDGTHDAQAVFESTVRVGRELCEGKRIDAVALSGTWHSVMLCDEAMTPQTPVYPWTYTGASALCTRLREDPEYTAGYYQATGCMVHMTYPFFKLKLLRQQGWDLRKYRILGQGTYNSYRLTGQWAVSDCMASATGLLNITTRDFDGALLDELGIGPENLGRLVTYRDALALSAQGARLLGVEPGIPVVPCMSDGGLNQVGSDALREGIMTLSVGTSGALRLSTSRPVLPQSPSVWCYLSPKSWLAGAATSGCCNCMDWFKSGVGGDHLSYDELEQGPTGPKEDIPTFLPFLYGERCPGWNDARRASFHDIKPTHTVYDLHHAVLEGVLYNLYQCYGILVENNGPPSKIKLSGGILHSEIWTQMCADIFGVEMELDQVEQSSLMGGVILAMYHLGLIREIDAAGPLLPARRKVVVPDPGRVPVYREKYLRYLTHYGEHAANGKATGPAALPDPAADRLSQGEGNFAVAIGK